jgi:hypothetical protein
VWFWKVREVSFDIIKNFYCSALHSFQFCWHISSAIDSPFMCNESVLGISGASKFWHLFYRPYSFTIMKSFRPLKMVSHVSCVSIDCKNCKSLLIISCHMNASKSVLLECIHSSIHPSCKDISWVLQFTVVTDNEVKLYLLFSLLCRSAFPCSSR